MPTIWVALLRISDRTAHKIATVHGVGADEVRDAIQCVAGIPFVWDDDPDRGRRAILRVSIRENRYLVVLYLADDPTGDVWHLGSAYRDS